MFGTLYSATHDSRTSCRKVRAVWYVNEVLAQESNHKQNAIVQIVNSSKATIWDFDSKLYPWITYLEENAFPIRVAAHHLCAADSSIMRFIKPVRTLLRVLFCCCRFLVLTNTFGLFAQVVLALKSRSSRTRIQVHIVPEHEIVNHLPSYGIHAPMLPTDLGGTVQLNQLEWIALRRAVEMEEL